MREQVVSQGASRDGAPEFGREQEGHDAVGSRQFQSALSERNGDIRLDAEGTSAGGVSCDRGESCAEVGACRGVEVVRADPGWVADDQVEATVSGGVGEVRAELEVDGASIIQSSQSASVLREQRAHGGEAPSLGGGESCAGAEERSFACRSEQIRAFVVECGYRAQRQFACVVAFQCIDACRGRFLLRSCAGGVVLSECGQASRPGEWLVIECVMAQGIADVDVVVQVRERRDLSCVGRVVVDDDGEPEPEFAEPDGHRCDVDAEDGCREDVASDRGGRAWIAELLAECREAFEGGDEESTGAAGRVEDAEGGESVEDRRGVVRCHDSSRQCVAECVAE